MLLHSLRIWNESCLRFKYVPYSCLSQRFDNQNVTKTKANYEVKSRWKAMPFASNYPITCFILRCYLMQIATWLASDYSARWQKQGHRSHKMALHKRRKRIFISIWWARKVLKMRKKINKREASPPAPLQGEMRIIEPLPRPLSEERGE